MIVPMKKVSFVVMDDTKKEALKNLRKLGVVHLEQVQGSGNALADLKETYSKLETVSLLLSEVKVDKKSALKQEKLSRTDAVSKADSLIELTETLKNYEDRLLNADSELKRLSGWGGFNPEDFSQLAEKGLFLTPYEASPDYYKNIPEEVNHIYVNSDKNQVRFLVLTDDGTKPEVLGPEASPVVFPEMGTAQLSEDCVKIRGEISSIKKEINSNVIYLETIKEAMTSLEKDIEFENVYSGMENDGEEGTEARLAWLTGYVPSEDLPQVKAAAKENNWGFLADDPGEEDEVPTKLKNNKFVSLIYPVSDFLGTVPGYREYDISNWFLLFFCIFFGMIFGDGGYGLLIVLASIIGIFMALGKKQKPGPAMFLLMLIGLSTTVWGALTCNWFGLLPEQLPAAIKPFLLSIDWNFISNASTLPADVVKQNLQIFCFSLALAQLSIAHLKGIIRYIKSPKALGEFGSLAMLWGLFYLVLFMVVDGTRFPLDKIILGVPVKTLMIASIGGGFALSFIFSSYEGSIKDSILDSCKNIISVLLGVVNYFSDIVSYIRLWAVGLAGAAISSTVNQMAGPTLGGALIFLGILLLGFGHGLNMILNVLSVIVHGVRLNTLEFSSHLGMSWSGFSYKPFAEK